ncbi:MAG: hypothetical protein NC236_01335 [Mycoplasma sp.]|nr:hypothetical protein [Mycoplasma sp.]
MDLANILLWTFDMIANTASVFLSLAAAVSSSKANAKLTNLIETSWVEDEIHSIYMKIKNSSVSNKKMITTLNKDEVKTYAQYANHASQTRIPFISSRAKELLAKSIYFEWISDLIIIKKAAEKKFLTFFDIKKIDSPEKIPPEIKEKIKEYHKNLGIIYKQIQSNFVYAAT